MQQDNFIDVYLARHVSGAYAHHQEHTDGAAHTTYAAALMTTTHPQTRCRKPYAATQHLMLLMMGVCARNMSSYEYINKITLLHQVGITHYFM